MPRHTPEMIEKFAEVTRLRAGGMTLRAIANHMGMSAQNVSIILHKAARYAEWLSKPTPPISVVADYPLCLLNVSVRSRNGVYNMGLGHGTVGEFLNRPRKQVLRTGNFGAKSYDEIIQAIKEAEAEYHKIQGGDNVQAPHAGNSEESKPGR